MFFLNSVTLLRMPFFTEQLWWLLLVIRYAKVHYKNPVMQFFKRIHEFLQQYHWCKLSNFVIKGLQHSCFFVNVAKILRTPFFNGCFWKYLCFFIKHSDLISYFYKNKNEVRQNSIEIKQTYVGRKNCNKIK